MSDAMKCDVCGVLFEQQRLTVHLNLDIGLDDTGTRQGWSEIDLCVPCGEKVIAIVKPACNDFDEVANGEKRS